MFGFHSLSFLERKMNVGMKTYLHVYVHVLFLPSLIFCYVGLDLGMLETGTYWFLS